MFSPRAVTGLPRPPQWKQISGCGRETLGAFNRCVLFQRTRTPSTAAAQTHLSSPFTNISGEQPKLNSCPETSRERDVCRHWKHETSQTKPTHRGAGHRKTRDTQKMSLRLLKLQTETLENITKMFILLRNMTQWVTVIIYHIVDAQKRPLNTIITPLISATHLSLKSFQLRGFSHYNEPRPGSLLTKLSKDRESS